jgi:hypothetical protein
MKNSRFMNVKVLRFLSAALVITASGFLSGCKDDDPKKEDTPELITKATLTFTPTGGSPVVVTATDPDGEGVQNIKMDGPINLAKNTTYVLTLTLVNGLAQQGQDGYDVSAEVEAEGDEHQFFFSWTNDAFSNPAGNGNIDNRTDPLNYTGGQTSKDKNNRPLGLTTTWTASANAVSGGSFRVLLKHQPSLKSDTSDSNTGETDLDVTFTINVQ